MTSNSSTMKQNHLDRSVLLGTLNKSLAVHVCSACALNFFSFLLLTSFIKQTTHCFIYVYNPSQVVFLSVKHGENTCV